MAVKHAGDILGGYVRWKLNAFRQNIYCRMNWQSDVLSGGILSGGICPGLKCATPRAAAVTATGK